MTILARVPLGSWQMRLAGSRKPWRRRPRPNYPCPSLAECPGTAQPRLLATPAVTWRLPSRPQSPPPPPSAAARQQVWQVCLCVCVYVWLYVWSWDRQTAYACRMDRGVETDLCKWPLLVVIRPCYWSLTHRSNGLDTIEYQKMSCTKINPMPKRLISSTSVGG